MMRLNILNIFSGMLKNLSLKKKFLLIFFLCAVLPMVISSFLFYQFSMNTLINREHSAISQSLGLIKGNVNTKLMDYEEKFKELYKDNRIFELASQNINGYLSELQILEMNTRLHSFISGKDNIDSIYFFLNNGQVSYYDNIKPEPYISLYKNNLSWADEIRRGNGKACWISSFSKPTGNGNSSNIHIISFGRVLKNIYSNSQDMGNVVINIQTDTLSEICRPVKISEKGMILIMDRKGNLIWHENPEWISKNVNTYEFYKQLEQDKNGIFEKKIDNRDFLIVHVESTYNNWSYVALIPKSDILSEIGPIRLYFILIAFICVLFFFFGTLIVGRYITNPLKSIIVAMDRIKTGGIGLNKYKIESNDEIGVLYRSFNSMNAKIAALIEEIRITNKREKEQEIKALQAQINPHFIYNTLDTINWMVLDGKTEEVTKMLISLSRILRYSISKTADYVTFEEEMKWIENYIYIQKNRFEDLFQVEYDIDDRVYPLKTLKLIMQPIVENAIIHGFKNISGGGIIKIKMWVENDFVFIEISDNGEGIPDEQIVKMKEGRNSGYGVYNVHQRIRLNFGEKYGIDILRKPKGGTLVRICQPAIE